MNKIEQAVPILAYEIGDVQFFLKIKRLPIDLTLQAIKFPFSDGLNFCLESSLDLYAKATTPITDCTGIKPQLLESNRLDNVIQVYFRNRVFKIKLLLTT